MKKLELNQMENLEGLGDVLTDRRSCDQLANGLGGAATIIGFGSWWTGAGAGLAIGISLGAGALQLYCSTL